MPPQTVAPTQVPRQAVDKPAEAPSLAGRRWLISFDHSGKEQIRPIPEDAGVMTLREMLNAVATGDLWMSTDELFQLSATLHHRIEQRTVTQAQQLKELQQKVMRGR
jgi:hypothetical protein